MITGWNTNEINSRNFFHLHVVPSLIHVVASFGVLKKICSQYILYLPLLHISYPAETACSWRLYYLLLYSQQLKECQLYCLAWMRKLINEQKNK